MTRVRVLALACCMACGGQQASVSPKPSELAADSARSTLIAALIDAPPETLRVITPMVPRGTPGRSAAAVIAFTVDSAGKPDPSSMTIVHAEGDPSFPKKVCATVPQVRFVPPASGGPSLDIVPFISFSSPMPAAFDTLYRGVRTRLEKMSTVDRRDFFLNRGCRHYR